MLPLQLVAVAVDCADGLAALSIRGAIRRHNSARLRKICLQLLPEQTTSSAFLAAGVAYRESLRRVFDTALKHVVELNISSFHFGPDLDLSDLLRDGSLQFLQSLSTSTCGLRRPLAALQMFAGDYAAAPELCHSPSSLGYARLMPVIDQCSKPRCLVIEYRSLQFQKEFLLS
ncbi:hypothetical protein MTO96_043859 [Rhipicephalus appendiculatus]